MVHDYIKHTHIQVIAQDMNKNKEIGIKKCKCEGEDVTGAETC